MKLSRDDLKKFFLAEHGDSQERRNASFLSSSLPNYESFWRNHIVPLTFRVVDDRIPYIRPSVGSRAKALANASYATMYHLTWAEEYRQRIGTLEKSERVNRTEGLYCFLSHASSGLDAIGRLAEAVDGICGEAVPFGARLMERGGWEFPNLAKVENSAAAMYRDLRDIVAVYRNHVVHDCPIYILNDLMPSKSALRRSETKYSGLAALGEAVKRGTLSSTAYVKIDAELLYIVARFASTVDVWYKVANSELSGLDYKSYERLQLEGLVADSRLKRSHFEDFFERSQ